MISNNVSLYFPLRKHLKAVSHFQGDTGGKHQPWLLLLQQQQERFLNIWLAQGKLFLCETSPAPWCLSDGMEALWSETEFQISTIQLRSFLKNWDDKIVKVPLNWKERISMFQGLETVYWSTHSKNHLSTKEANVYSLISTLGGKFIEN